MEISEGSNPLSEKAIIFFDGHCNLCNKSVQFILKKERASVLYFASLQSEFAKTILLRLSLPEDYTDSVLLYEKGHLYKESEAAIRIAKYLKSPWSWARIIRVVPTFLRNWVYRIIAKKRLKWFGSTDSCWIMQTAWRERFISDLR